MTTRNRNSTRGDLDSSFMGRAFELAKRGRGATSPNPVVGAVIVRNGAIVGAGYHERYGGPHAEVNALAEAGPRASGATLYVTLEPCSISGNTPPCTDAIVAAGIARTVVPVEDPNPRISGRGVSILREAGIDVDVGLMHKEAQILNAPYFKYRSTGLPFTTLKLALSLDGRIAPPPGGPRWTSSEASRELVHTMRANVDCVMVGIGTILADDPLLTVRRAQTGGQAPGGGRGAGGEFPDGGPRQSARLVLDTHLRIPPDSAIVTGARDVRSIVACCESADPSRRAQLEGAGVAVWCVGAPDGRLDLPSVLRRAAKEGLISVLSEGGATVASSLLKGGLVDRVAFFVTPRLYGAAGVPALGALDNSWWGEHSRLTQVRWTEIGGDCLFEAEVSPRTRETT
ncbi:MAG: bifunctional diaminohydroxyphosphoribosylaminopyrimidine deaminase/5-amino-6-(5-phosphoribosylamino)uracil reductase RibD [Candidatus Eisenbacteria sp.]|nr:bifunctional diaminohydroxyphosphoribosylaminopyrimidine deaminase/5-amino-6-(5-phosphoribosylamino)uracil reductase RibD [Candidatus Eisenbacteria bacterium]